MELFSKKDLIRLIVPLVIEQILAVTIGMVDSVMVSSVGEAAVSGVSLIDSINILFINIFSALATGGAVIAAQYIGRREPKNACTAAKQLLYSTTALALIITLIAVLLKNPILSIFGNIDADVRQNAEIYLYLSAASYPFLAIYNSGAALFRSMGNSKVSMVTSVIMNVMNLIGNAIGIYGLKMGVAGAALSTLIARIAGAVIVTVLIINPSNVIHINKLFRPELKFGMIKSILQLGIPNGLENGMFQVGKILVASIVAAFGTTAIAANSVAGNLAGMEILPGSAIGLAMITVVGQCIGAKDYDQVKLYTKKLMKLTYLCMGATCILIFIAARPLVGFYHLSDETMSTAVDLLRLHSAFCIVIWPAAFTLPNALRAANDVKFTMTAAIISMWACRLGLSYLFALALNMGVLGVWLAMCCEWGVRATAFVIRFLRGKWMNKQVI